MAAIFCIDTLAGAMQENWINFVLLAHLRCERLHIAFLGLPPETYRGVGVDLNLHLVFSRRHVVDCRCSRFNAGINALFKGVFIRLSLSARVIALSLKCTDGMTAARIGHALDRHASTYHRSTQISENPICSFAFSTDEFASRHSSFP